MYINIAKRQLFAENTQRTFPTCCQISTPLHFAPHFSDKTVKLESTYIIFTTSTRPKSFSVVALTSFNISGASKDSVRRAWITSGVEVMLIAKKEYE